MIMQLVFQQPLPINSEMLRFSSSTDCPTFQSQYKRGRSETVQKTRDSTGAGFGGRRSCEQQ